MLNWIKPDNKAIIFSALFVFLFFAVYYFILLYCRVSTDIQPHAAIAHSFVVNHDKLTPNFLYFLLLALFSGFSKYYPLYYGASIFLLSAAITAKFLLNDFYLRKYNVCNNRLYSLGLSFAMLFVFALPGLEFLHTKDFYLGQLAPNVWHNSTVIFLMPFALLLFFKSYELFFLEEKQQRPKLLVQIALLIIINALIKPSFLFTLLPSAFLFFLLNRFFYKNRETKWQYLLPYFFGIFFIVAEYYIIYKLNYTSSVTTAQGESSSISIAPFEVWGHFSRNIPVAIITSLFFPLLYIVVSKGKCFNNKIVQFAAVNFIIGLGTWIVFAEEGARKFHGNFFWQIVATTYLLFFSLLINFITDIKLKRLSRIQQYIMGGAFALHFAWGLFYWVKIIIFNGYS